MILESAKPSQKTVSGGNSGNSGVGGGVGGVQRTAAVQQSSQLREELAEVFFFKLKFIVFYFFGLKFWSQNFIYIIKLKDLNNKLCNKIVSNPTYS